MTRPAISTHNLDRQHCFYLREVTGELPEFPDEFYGAVDVAPEDQNERDILKDTYMRGRWFYVELHIRKWGWYGPIAQGTVCVTEDRVEILGMSVVDGLREQGYGRALIEYIGKEWSNVEWCDCPISRGFMDELVKQGVAIRKPQNGSYDRSLWYSFGKPLDRELPKREVLR